jgi:hypothetical protein
MFIAALLFCTEVSQSSTGPVDKRPISPATGMSYVKLNDSSDISIFKPKNNDIFEAI